MPFRQFRPAGIAGTSGTVHPTAERQPLRLESHSDLLLRSNADETESRCDLDHNWVLARDPRRAQVDDDARVTGLHLEGSGASPVAEPLGRARRRTGERSQIARVCGSALGSSRDRRCVVHTTQPAERCRFTPIGPPDANWHCRTRRRSRHCLCTTATDPRSRLGRFASRCADAVSCWRRNRRRAG